MIDLFIIKNQFEIIHFFMAVSKTELYYAKDAFTILEDYIVVSRISF